MLQSYRAQNDAQPSFVVANVTYTQCVYERVSTCNYSYICIDQMREYFNWLSQQQLLLLLLLLPFIHYVFKYSIKEEIKA